VLLAACRAACCPCMASTSRQLRALANRLPGEGMLMFTYRVSRTLHCPCRRLGIE
jgi:hypothetical protein